MNDKNFTVTHGNLEFDLDKDQVSIVSLPGLDVDLRNVIISNKQDVYKLMYKLGVKLHQPAIEIGGHVFISVFGKLISHQKESNLYVLLDHVYSVLKTNPIDFIDKLYRVYGDSMFQNGGEFIRSILKRGNLEDNIINNVLAEYMKYYEIKDRFLIQ